jgi:ABC-2 type transport system ATP-binding protein
MRQSLSVLAAGVAPASTDAVVEATGLVKRFGAARALDGLDLTVARGEVHGFLGPNGAGKSTAIRGLLGQLRLDAGSARVFGLDPWRQAVEIHGLLAYVPGDVALWPSLTGGECIDLLLSLQGSGSRRRRAELLDRFQLDPTKRVRTYSKGNRQKVALIAALATDAELLVLDEPTSGLDPVMEAEFQSSILEARDAGRTVLLSSHILGEVEALCDRVTIIRQGRTVRTGTLDALRGDTLTSIEAVTAQPVVGLGRLEGVSALVERPVPGAVRTTFRAAQDELARAVGLVVAAQPTSLVVAPPSLDELFLGHYQQELPAGAAVIEG